jgi:diaminohydroxyphosphoribosylaminopyrimidine deaminase/5-amino-6-(5-phosphoribosylamino)uracil reductase
MEVAGVWIHAMAQDSSIDAAFMRRAIDLAMRGRGAVEPNPMVGCVIVKQGQIIGEGWHERYGGPHAEPRALAACTQSPAGATAYVTLEPCCHTNKQTPPCAPRLIEAGIGRVVVGCVDPNPAGSGGGIQQLRTAGVRVEVGVLEKVCRQLIAPFLARVTLSRPYVTLKWAQTADGKVAGAAGRHLQISNAASMRQVHELRARCDAIAMGIGTALADDPMLTARRVASARPLRRVVFDRLLRLPPGGRLVQTARQCPTLVFHAKEAAVSQAEALRAAGVDVREIGTDAQGRLRLGEALGALGEMGVTHLLVEPGPTLARSFLTGNHADRAWIFHAPTMLDDATAPAAERLVDWVKSGEAALEGDRLEEWLNPRSGIYFVDEESADLKRTRLG